MKIQKNKENVILNFELFTYFIYLVILFSYLFRQNNIIFFSSFWHWIKIFPACKVSYFKKKKCYILWPQFFIVCLHQLLSSKIHIFLIFLLFFFSGLLFTVHILFYLYLFFSFYIFYFLLQSITNLQRLTATYQVDASTCGFLACILFVHSSCFSVSPGACFYRCLSTTKATIIKDHEQITYRKSKKCIYTMSTIVITSCCLNVWQVQLMLSRYTYVQVF